MGRTWCKLPMACLLSLCPLYGWVPRKDLERLGYERVLGKDIAAAAWFHTCLSFRHFRNGGVIEPASLCCQNLLSLLDFKPAFANLRNINIFGLGLSEAY